MTISSTNRKAGPFIGNNATTAFPFSFKVFQASDLLVVRANSSGAETTLVLDTDYTVALNVNAPGGTVTLPAALATGYTLVVTTNLDALQPVDLTNQGAFYPSVINSALDRLTILIQQLFERMGRAIAFPLSDGTVDPTLPSKDSRKGRLLAFDATTGNPTAGPTIGDANTMAANMANINTVSNNIGAVNTVSTNMSTVLAAPTNAATAKDAAAYLSSYMSQVVMNVTFPLDLGLITDPVLYNHFDLGFL